PLLLALAPRRSGPVRHLWSRPSAADRTGVARWAARQPRRLAPRPQRRAPDDPALDGWPPALRHELALLDLGQPVLPGPSLLAPAGELRAGRWDGGRPGLLRRLPRPLRRSSTSPRGAPPGRRLHHGDLPVIAHIGGFPVEETIGSLGPVLLVAVG